MARSSLVLVLLVAVGGLSAALVYSQWRTPPPKVSGFVEADEIRVGSRVGGRVAEVRVAEGQRVAKGAPLLRLEPYDLLALQARARAERDAAERELARMVAGLRPEEVAQTEARRERLAAQLAELEAGPRKEEIAVADARLEQAKAQLQLAEHTHARVERLADSARASGQDLDRAVETLQNAKAMLEVRRQEVAVLRAGTRPEVVRAARAALQEADAALQLARQGYRAEDIAQARARLAARDAELAGIDAQLAELEVTAPVEGEVEAVDLQPGDIVAANAPVLTIVDTRALWVRAYLPENRLGFAPGHEVDVTIDSFPKTVFKGRITFVSPQAEFTPRNVQTPEERSKQVFRIKVTLLPAEVPLRPGMAADVWLEPRRKE